jgi:hypothetical protein
LFELLHIFEELPLRGEHQQMAEERTTTANSVWEVLDTLFYRVSMLISLGFPVAYFLLRYVNPPDHSFLAFLCDFLSALITSVVPVA